MNAQKEKSSYLRTVQLWPKSGIFSPEEWLSNFCDKDTPFAMRLLDGFTFYSSELVESMFKSSFLNLSQYTIKNKEDFKLASRSWSTFIDNIIVVRVTGEKPNDTDSGYTFSRMARDILNIPQERILSPESALEYIARGNTCDVVFVDDFVGSGQQFVTLWDRIYKILGNETSFFNISCLRTDINFYYCPVICTEYGMNTIYSKCRNIKISTAHIFGEQQSLLSANSSIWRDDMRTSGPEFLERVSITAGIPDKDGDVGCWRGFHKLGLALAFEHGCPDATVPLFYHSSKTWKPLIKRGTL